MISLVVAGAIAAAPSPQGDEMQSLAGPDFTALVQAVEARCPASRLLYVKPAVLLDAEETFHDALSPRRRTNLDRLMKADEDVQRCATRDGASCTATATLGVYRKAGLTREFVTAICRRGGASWG